MSDRELILERIRAARADVPASEPTAWIASRDPDPAAAYERERSLPGPEATALFVERCADYAATVSTCSGEAAAISRQITEIAARHRAVRLAAPDDLDPAWAPEGVEMLRDHPVTAPLSRGRLNAADGVLSGCTLAIAETGTIVLDGGRGQGRRILTLVPDLHICVVPAERIVVSVPAAITALREAVRAGAPITFISGPSATSDIELNRVEGVHGPRRLEVIVAGGVP